MGRDPLRHLEHVLVLHDKVCRGTEARRYKLARPIALMDPLRFGSLDDAAMESATRKVMGRLNPKFRNFKTAVKSLSGGQRQSVAIARAIHFNARVLIMDEPTAALGPAETAQVRDLVAQLKQEGIGIFLISHDIHDVFDLADRISVMLQGKLVGTVDKHKVTKDEVLAMIIMGKLPEDVSAKDLAILHG